MRAIMVLALATMLMSGCAGRNPSDANEATVADTDPEMDRRQEPEGPSAAPAGETTVHMLTGHFTASVLYLGGVQTPNSSLYFDVPTNASALVIELRWTGDTSDFALGVFTPRVCKPGPTDVALANSVACQANWMAALESDGMVIRDRALGSYGPGALRIDFDEAAIQAEPCGQDACQWRAIARDYVAVDSNFDLRVSVFLDREVPDGYTAFVDA